MSQTIGFGREIEAECRSHGVAFFDGSRGLELALERAERYLLVDAGAAG